MEDTDITTILLDKAKKRVGETQSLKQLPTTLLTVSLGPATLRTIPEKVLKLFQDARDRQDFRG